MAPTGIRPKFRQKYGLIPYGLQSGGKLITPRDANSFHTYRCPECKGRISVKKSKFKKPHFSHHQMKDQKCLLYNSSVTLAKWVLRYVFQQWIAGDLTPIEIRFLCQYHLIPQNQIGSIKWNQRYRGHLSHLSLHDHNGKALLYIEIRDEARKPHLQFPHWLEVSTEDVLSNPYSLESLNPDMDPPSFFKYEQLDLFSYQHHSPKLF